MTGKWDYSVISQVQHANDIADVISEHLKLEKKGKEMVGLCPFHTDHKPSLYVNPSKQIFKCFACGAGGDVLKFVQMKENLTFPQAVERLAQRAGIRLEPVQSRRDDSQDSGLDTATLAKINMWTLNHWIANLWDEQKGGTARQYLEQRKISVETAKTWQLGLAVDAWDDLVAKATEKKAAAKSLIRAGLAVEKERGGCYDKFRNRLMFPIIDVTGRVIGFGGRTLADDPAKYMNSPATALFDKSHSLYGLDRARQAISDTGTAIVAEGYTDVIMAHQFGIHNVVAALGTSLTNGHARILKRYAKRIVLLFDSDIAGKSAANRALEICLGEKVAVQLAFVPEGKDPCDYLLEAGTDAFKTVIDAAEDVLEFKWKILEEQLQKGENLSDRTEAIRQFLQTAAAAFESRKMDSISRTVVLSRLGELLKSPPSRIEEEIAKIQRQRQRTARNESTGTSSMSEEQNTQPTLLKQAQREILEVLLHEPGLYDLVADRIQVSDFKTYPALGEIAEVLFQCLNEGVEPEMARLYGQIESPATATVLGELESIGSRKGDPPVRLEESVRVLEEIRHQEEVERLKDFQQEDDETNYLRKKQQMAQKGLNRRAGSVI
ncbi:MAG: DNA primase [Phycisphaerae bacterium]|nr:DNA primase [Phycisphaerae bacterium]